jgi:hypothetical protein
MAVAVENADGANSEGDGVSSITVVGFTTSGSNRQILVGAGVRSGSATVTGVVRGAETYTKLDTADEADFEGSLWRSDSEPATTGTDVVASIDDTKKLAIGVIALSGVDQSTPYGTAATNTSSGATSLSVSPGSASGDLMIDTICMQGDATNQAPSEAGQSEEVAALDGGDSSGRVDLFMSSRAGGAGTTTMGWTWTTSVPCAQVGVATKPAAAAGQPMSLRGTAVPGLRRWQPGLP